MRQAYENLLFCASEVLSPYEHGDKKGEGGEISLADEEGMISGVCEFVLWGEDEERLSVRVGIEITSDIADELERTFGVNKDDLERETVLILPVPEAPLCYQATFSRGYATQANLLTLSSGDIAGLCSGIEKAVKDLAETYGIEPAKPASISPIGMIELSPPKEEE